LNFYLSYGAGVGSEALRLWLLENNWPHEAVYVDHGCDWPETREFVKTIPNLTIIKPDVQGFDNLYEYCLEKQIIPFTNTRFCSDKFKSRPLEKYFKQPAITYLGITIDEAHRVHGNKKDIYYHYPFVCLGMTRQDCIQYIHERTGIVPMRSGCWFCPFQNKGRWRLLYHLHPDLYQKAKELEATSTRGLVLDRKLESIVQENQGRLF